MYLYVFFAVLVGECEPFSESSPVGPSPLGRGGGSIALLGRSMQCNAQHIDDSDTCIHTSIGIILWVCRYK